MGRRSSVKTTVQGMPLREYLLKSLVEGSYRQLIDSRRFRMHTGMKSIHTLYTWAKRKYKITLEEVYMYGKEHFLIADGKTFKEWMYETGRKIHYDTHCAGKDFEIADFEKSVYEPTIDDYINIGKKYSLVFSKSTSVEIIKDILLDFMTEEELEDEIKKIK